MVFDDEELAKNALAHLLECEIKKQGLSETKIRETLNVGEYKLECIYQGDFAEFTLFELMRFLNYLGRDVYITVFPNVGGKKGKIRIGHFDVEDDGSDARIADAEMKIIGSIE